MDPTPKRMFEGPSLEQIDQAKRGARSYEAIEKARDMIRKRVSVPPGNGGGKPKSNDVSPPIKSKFE